MYVAISAELVTRVKQKIELMRDAEVGASVPSLHQPVMSADGSLLYNIAQFGAYLPLLDIIPKNWLQKVDRTECISVQYRFGDRVNYIPVEFKNMANAYIKPNHGQTNYSARTAKIAEEEVQELPEDIPGRDTVLQRVNDARLRDEIHARYGKIETDIMELLKAAKSINEVVKLVPSIKMYLDPIDIERLERKVDRKPREALTLDIDVEGLTAAAVSARLANTI